MVIFRLGHLITVAIVSQGSFSNDSSGLEMSGRRTSINGRFRRLKVHGQTGLFHGDSYRGMSSE